MNARCNSHPLWGTAKIIFALPAALTAALLLTAAQPAAAQPGWVLWHQKISDTRGGFTGILRNEDFFGSSVASLGDLNGDGVGDLAVGAVGDGRGNRGAVWVLFLNRHGMVKCFTCYQKISSTDGDFTGTLDPVDWFGASVASLGDLNGDGVGDLAVGAPLDDDGGENRGAVWVLFLNRDGKVKCSDCYQKISAKTPGLIGLLDDGDEFGYSVASLGDLDGDGVGDLAVGAPDDDDGGEARGAVWVLFLNRDGTLKSHKKISQTEGGFTGTLHDFDLFGSSVASLGDLDEDGVGELAVGARLDDDGGFQKGAVWVLFLNRDGTVKPHHQKISSLEGGFTGDLDRFDLFGVSVAGLPDLDGDCVPDLAVGAMQDDDGGPQTGAVWVLFLKKDGTVKPDHQKISATEGGFPRGELDGADLFGASLASLGDLDAAGLAVGAYLDDDGGPQHGAVWLLSLGAACSPCDMNCDCFIDARDIEPFLELLYEGGEPCSPCAGDVNLDGAITAADIEPFLHCLFPDWR